VAANNIRLSSTITVRRYLEMEQAEDRAAIARFVVNRFDERYFVPMENDRRKKHGFALLAVACLVIETLESFYQGRADTHKVSGQMFAAFFARDTPLKVFGGGGAWFYKDVRCGILHQGEARRGWRILRQGPLLDSNARSINATRFLRELRQVVVNYAAQLVTDDECWKHFKTKMKAVCKNCDAPAGTV
jgi:hypothetical protein